MRIATATSVLITALSASAHAGTFGGFSRSGSVYLSGRDQVCKPIPLPKLGQSSMATPSCSRQGASQIAGHRFQKPPAQAGASADFSASAQGMTLNVTNARTRLVVVSWSASDPINRVVAVYATKAKDLIAVEFETRMGGAARQEVVVFRLPAAARPATPAQPTTPVPTAPVTNLTRKQAKQVAKLLQRGERFARRRRHKRAIALFKKALVIDPSNPEAQYRIAASHVGQKKTAEALAALKALAASKDPRAMAWLIEARFAKTFRKLFGNKMFRAVVGLDRKPGQATSAYERVVGFGGRWEQSGQVCEKAWVNLRLRRLPRPTFSLKIRSRCRGYLDTTTLGGTWSASGRAQLDLTLPNQGGKSEKVVCRLHRCTDGSNEDCMRCPIAADINVTLRVVRR